MCWMFFVALQVFFYRPDLFFDIHFLFLFLPVFSFVTCDLGISKWWRFHFDCSDVHLKMFVKCVFNRFIGHWETVIHLIPDCRLDTAHEILKWIIKCICVMTDELFYVSWYLWIKVFSSMNRKIGANDQNEKGKNGKNFNIVWRTINALEKNKRRKMKQKKWR